MTRINLKTVVASSWVLTSVVLTVLIYSDLGSRGIFWLWIHHIICLSSLYLEFNQELKTNLRTLFGK